MRLGDRLHVMHHELPEQMSADPQIKKGDIANFGPGQKGRMEPLGATREQKRSLTGQDTRVG